MKLWRKLWMLSVVILCMSCGSAHLTSDEYEEMQQQKDRTNVPEARAVRDVTVAQIVGWSAGRVMPKPGKSRDDWSKADRKYLYEQEQQAVRVTGYLKKVAAQPDGDVHLYMVGSIDAPISSAIIAEMTPYFLKTRKWDTASLQQDTLQQIRVTGWLLWDEEHDKGPDRATVWEVHPITDFEMKTDSAWIRQ